MYATRNRGLACSSRMTAAAAAAAAECSETSRPHLMLLLLLLPQFVRVHLRKTDGHTT